MLKPNLFILGAPKCGTTSLASWLGDHPHIFMSPAKEPHYFDTDHKQDSIGNFENYEALFKKASKKHKIIGEASTRYLSSEVAVENILKFNSNVKFIVCLRNPVKMAQSLHQQTLFAGFENLKSFEKAWGLQEVRKNGNHIPFYCKDLVRLQYGYICSLGSQVEDLLMKVPRERVHFILLDDLKENALGVYKKTLDFLEVEYQGRSTFDAENTAKTYRSKTFQQVILALSALKKGLGIHRGTGIRKWNNKKQKRKPLSEKMRRELDTYFESEILKLERILDRDLSHWTGVP